MITNGFTYIAVLVFIAIVVAYAWGMSYFERQDTAASHD